MKKHILLFTALIAVLTLTACGQKPADEISDGPAAVIETPPAEQTANETSDQLSGVYPLTVTDQLGREVIIEKEPETLVSGYYISTSILLALGQTDKLVGIEAKAKSRPIYRLSAPQIIELPSVGTAKEFDLEGCAALHPDLVIVPAKLKDSIPALEELGLTVLAVNPEDGQLLQEAVTLLGAATGSKERAAKLLSFISDQQTALSSFLEGAEPSSLYLAGNSSFLSTAGPAMYQHTLITNAGASNCASELTDSYWAEISYEQLLAWNPDYIILASDSSYTVEDVLADPNLSDCNAVKSGNVYQLPNAFEAVDSPVPGSFLGSLWLASILHPDAYSKEQWQQTATEFYETFYGFTPDFDNLYITGS